MEKERLQELSSDQEDMYTYASRMHRTIMETLTDFPKTAKKVSFAFLNNVFWISQAVFAELLLYAT